PVGVERVAEQQLNQAYRVVEEDDDVREDAQDDLRDPLRPVLVGRVAGGPAVDLQLRGLLRPVARVVEPEDMDVVTLVDETRGDRVRDACEPRVCADVSVPEDARQKTSTPQRGRWMGESYVSPLSQSSLAEMLTSARVRAC